MDSLYFSEQSGVMSVEDALAQLEKKRYSIEYQIRRFTQNREDIEDIWQEVSLKVAQKIHTLEDNSALISWARKIAHNLAFNHVMRRKSVRAHGNIELEFTENDDENPLKQAIQHEHAHHIVEIVESLDDMYHSVVFPFYFEGKSLIQISDELRIPVGTVKRRLHVFRERTRERFKWLFES